MLWLQQLTWSYSSVYDTPGATLKISLPLVYWETSQSCDFQRASGIPRLRHPGWEALHGFPPKPFKGKRPCGAFQIPGLPRICTNDATWNSKHLQPSNGRHKRFRGSDKFQHSTLQALHRGQAPRAFEATPHDGPAQVTGRAAGQICQSKQPSLLQLSFCLGWHSIFVNTIPQFMRSLIRSFQLW